MKMVHSLSERQNLIVSFVSDHPELSLYECSVRLSDHGIKLGAVYQIGQRVNKGNITNHANFG